MLKTETSLKRRIVAKNVLDLEVSGELAAGFLGGTADMSLEKALQNIRMKIDLVVDGLVRAIAESLRAPLSREKSFFEIYFQTSAGCTSPKLHASKV